MLKANKKLKNNSFYKHLSFYFFVSIVQNKIKKCVACHTFIKSANDFNVFVKLNRWNEHCWIFRLQPLMLIR